MNNEITMTLKINHIIFIFTLLFHNWALGKSIKYGDYTEAMVKCQFLRHTKIAQAKKLLLTNQLSEKNGFHGNWKSSQIWEIPLFLTFPK
jgi:Tfp pilus assembly protein PilF